MCHWFRIQKMKQKFKSLSHQKKEYLKNSRYRFQNFRDVDKILDTRQEILEEIQDIRSQIVYYHTQQQRIANKIGMSQKYLTLCFQRIFTTIELSYTP